MYEPVPDLLVLETELPFGVSHDTAQSEFISFFGPLVSGIAVLQPRA